MTKEILLHKRGAPIVQDLHVGFEAAIERHRDRPGPRKDVRVLDRDFILDGVLVDQRKAFDQTQRVTVEVAGAIKPRPTVEIPDLDNQRVSLPTDRQNAPSIAGQARGPRRPDE